MPISRSATRCQAIMIDTAMMVVRPRRAAWSRGGDGRLMTYDDLASLEFQAGFGTWEGVREVAALKKSLLRRICGRFSPWLIQPWFGFCICC